MIFGFFPIVKFIESESTPVDLPGAGEWDGGGVGRGNGDLVLNGGSFSWGRWKTLEIDDGEICIAVWMYWMPLNCKINMVKIICLHYMTFTTIKNFLS